MSNGNWDLVSAMLNGCCTILYYCSLVFRFVKRAARASEPLKKFRSISVCITNLIVLVNKHSNHRMKWNWINFNVMESNNFSLSFPFEFFFFQRKQKSNWYKSNHPSPVQLSSGCCYNPIFHLNSCIHSIKCLNVEVSLYSKSILRVVFSSNI